MTELAAVNLHTNFEVSSFIRLKIHVKYRYTVAFHKAQKHMLIQVEQFNNHRTWPLVKVSGVYIHIYT